MVDDRDYAFKYKRGNLETMKRREASGREKGNNSCVILLKLAREHNFLRGDCWMRQSCLMSFLANHT